MASITTYVNENNNDAFKVIQQATYHSSVSYIDVGGSREKIAAVCIPRGIVYMSFSEYPTFFFYFFFFFLGGGGGGGRERGGAVNLQLLRVQHSISSTQSWGSVHSVRNWDFFSLARGAVGLDNLM